MKIKQLFTSFLACMALWSAPVYANTEEDVYTKYERANSILPIGFRTDHLSPLENRYSIVDQLMNPSVEQLKDDMDKKKDSLNKATEYQKALKEFNDKYQDYLNELKPLIDKADNEKNRFKKKKARNKARNKMKDLILDDQNQYRNLMFQIVVGITENFVEGISSKIRKKEIKNDVTKMKNRYNTEITKAKSKIVTCVNKIETIIEKLQADYDKAKAAYDAAVKAGS